MHWPPLGWWGGQHEGGGLDSAFGVGNIREAASTRPQQYLKTRLRSEFIVNSSNFCFQAICKVELLSHDAKLLATSANSMF